MDIISEPIQIIESGSPQEDSRAFRRCLSQFATGVTVMTACNGTDMAGMSVNSFAALSLEPPLVLWSIRKESGSLKIFQEARHYAVNILSDNQVDLSNLFSKGDEDKFSKTGWFKGKLGAPLLRDVICTLECSLENTIDGGDHLILIGRVKHYTRYNGTPLLFYQGRYGVANDLSSIMNQTEAEKNASFTSKYNTHLSLLRRLHYVSHLVSSRFNTQRQELNISVAEFRIYSWLNSQAMSKQELQACIYLSQEEIKDALQEMENRNHLEYITNEKIHLTNSGREYAMFINQRVKSFEAKMIQNIDKKDLETALRVIDNLITQAKNA
ncbi:MAG: flavin reductase [Advenella sp.]|uniref:flavin reductase n=1 Tax=Advenella sp. TaxID=1872388 RepID=UPI00258853C7|nr:flavin reductase [Advenella sp.]MDD3758726.1 flavin reductase [Advenella sp.]